MKLELIPSGKNYWKIGRPCGGTFQFWNDALRRWGDGGTYYNTEFEATKRLRELQRTENVIRLGEIRVVDRADGVRGHYAIVRLVEGNLGQYTEVWTEGRSRKLKDGTWTSAGTVYRAKVAADNRLQELKRVAEREDYIKTNALSLVRELEAKLERAKKTIKSLRSLLKDHLART